jgi:hypothetical protein
MKEICISVEMNPNQTCNRSPRRKCSGRRSCLT